MLKIHPNIIHLLKCKAPINAIRIIAPPVRHRDDLPSPKEQEDEQHVEIEPCIERRSQEVVVPSPHLVSVPVCPESDDKPSDDAGGVAGADVAVEGGQAGEEDRRVEEMELGAWEKAVQDE